MYRAFTSSLKGTFIGFLILITLALVPAQSAATAPRVDHATKYSDTDGLSREERIELFNEVWAIINEKYHDPDFNGVNWKEVGERYRPLVDSVTSDDELYLLLKKMVGELRDAHTRFHTPRERREREELEGISTGISIYEVEGRTVVVSVEPESEAARAGIEAGMVVRTIDGKPVEEQIAATQTRIASSSSDRAVRIALYRRLLDGDKGTEVTLGLLRADGTEFSATVKRVKMSYPARVVSRLLPSGLGYIKLNLWKSPIHRDFKGALERLKETTGLIFDLRGNPGGEAEEVVKIASFFFKEKTSFGRFISRSGRSIELFTDRSSHHFYGRPVAILINEGSGSGSELFAGVMQERGRAIIVGRQSCGCVLGISKYRKVEGGGELSVSELRYLSPKGRMLEGPGVIPNEAVALTIADLRNRRDAAVEEAENSLRVAIKSTAVQN